MLNNRFLCFRLRNDLAHLLLMPLLCSSNWNIIEVISASDDVVYGNALARCVVTFDVAILFSGALAALQPRVRIELNLD